MSVFSSKKFLIPVIATVGVGTVAIGAGVGITVNQQKASEETNKTETVNWTQLTPASINLQKVVESINPTDVVIIAKKQSEANGEIRRKSLVEINDQLNRKNTYAFDVVKDQLALDEAKKTSIPSGVEISFELDTQTNNSASLNEGKLAIIVKALKDGEEKTNHLVLEGLKRIKTEIKSFLINQESKVVLDVATKQLSKKKDEFKSIEDLNKLTEITSNDSAPKMVVANHSSTIQLHDEKDTLEVANYLMFVNYSYKGLDSGMKVVFTPLVSLIRFGTLTDEKAPKAAAVTPPSPGTNPLQASSNP